MNGKNTAYRIRDIEFYLSKLRWKLKRNSKYYILNSTFIILTSCSSTVAQKSVKPYSEDLAKLRPKIELPLVEEKKKDTVKEIKREIAPTKNINAQIDVVLDSIDRFNQTKKFIDGFTIQIYSGQKRDDAMNMIKKMKEEVPELNPNPLKYEQPKFRVTVGKYFTRLEAQSDLLRLKRKFTTASVIPEKIQLSTH